MTLIGAMLACGALFPAGAAAHETLVASHGVDGRDQFRAASSRTAHTRAVSWCGQQTTADDTADQYANGDYLTHAIYALPADAPDRLLSLAGGFQASAMEASGLLERTYGRAIRFDMGTSCGPQYLDITTVRLPQSTAEMAGLVANQEVMPAVISALAGAGLPVLRLDQSATAVHGMRTNYLVWLDADVPYACGQSTFVPDDRRSEDNLNDSGGKVAVVFRDDASFCGPEAVRHELGHSLGAVLPGAPHTVDGAHCGDAFEDTMCLSSSPAVSTGHFQGEYFDYGNDDYWDPPDGPPLPWWTVNLSRFLCPDAGCNRPPAAVAAPAPVPAESTTGTARTTSAADAKPTASTAARRRARRATRRARHHRATQRRHHRRAAHRRHPTRHTRRRPRA